MQYHGFTLIKCFCGYPEPRWNAYNGFNWLFSAKTLKEARDIIKTKYDPYFTTGLMNIYLKLPTGERYLLVGGVGDMDCEVCYWGRCFEFPVSYWMAKLAKNPDNSEAREQIWQQSKKMADFIGGRNERLQRQFGWEVLAELIKYTLLKSVKDIPVEIIRYYDEMS